MIPRVGWSEFQGSTSRSGEVGGRFSRVTSGFITQLERARAGIETLLMRRFACAAAKDFEMPGSPGGGRNTPATHEEGDFRHAGLAAWE